MDTSVATSCQYPNCEAPADFKVMGGTSTSRMGACRAHLADAVEIIPGIRAGLESSAPGTRIVVPMTEPSWTRGEWRHPNGTDPDCPWCAAYGHTTAPRGRGR